MFLGLHALREKVDINADGTSDLATPLPGWLPIFLLAILPDIATKGAHLARQRVVIGAGLINVYLTFWFVGSQAGLFTVDGFLHPNAISNFLVLAVLSTAFLAATYFKVDQCGRMAVVRNECFEGWTWYFLSIQALVLVGSILVAAHESFLIVMVWCAAYLAAMVL